MRHDKSNIALAFDWAAGNDEWVLAGEVLLGSLAVFQGNGFAGEALDLFLRCRGPLNDTDPLLGDYLRVSMLFGVIALDEFGLARELATEVIGSTDPRCRAGGHAYLEFLTQRASRERADRHFEQATLALAECDGADDLNTRIVRAISSIHAFNLVYDGKYAEALALISSDVNAEPDHPSSEGIHQALFASMCHLFLGDPAKALETHPPLDGLAYAYGRSEVYKALIYLALDDAETATTYARQYSQEAATGRLSRACDDALIVLAAMSEAAGDHDRARELLLHSGLGRSPATVAYATRLAHQLGVAEQHREQEAVAALGLYAAGEPELDWPTPMTTLRDEMARRGWDS